MLLVVLQAHSSLFLIHLLFIFRIKCILGDGNILKADPVINRNVTSQYMEDDTNPFFFHLRHARDSSCLRCGVTDEDNVMLVSGPKVNPGDKYPWMVHIRARKKAGANEIMCSGALINEYFVITAAHCTVNKEGTNGPVQQFLEINVFFVMESEKKVSRGPKVEQVYPHPQYDGGNAHDISLIKLRRNVRRNKTVKPICLPNANAKRITPKGTDVFASGWGENQDNVKLNEHPAGFINPGRVLREAHLTIGTLDMCQKGNAIYAKPMSYLLCLIPDQNQFTCSGDSGSPLVLEYKGRYFIVGVHSGRTDESCSKSPKIANSVPHHMKWIGQVTGLRPDYPVTRDGKRFT